MSSLENKTYIIKKCEELMKTFNSVTHSVDTHCLEKLGDCTSIKAKADNVLIQQVIYGWYRERAVLEGFIENYYADNAACVLRSDMTMYTIFAYLALFRLEEMGFHAFKEFTTTQDPTKMFNFVSYLFNKENLWSCLRAEWMKVRDLRYVEDDLIAGVEQFLPELNRFCRELEEKAIGLAAAEVAKEEQKKSGTAGVTAVAKKASTRPISPNLTKPKAPIIPEPDQINQHIEAHEVPSFLNKTNLAQLTQRRRDELDEQRQQTRAKYDDSMLFKLHETKGGRKLDDIRREVEEQATKELAFDSSFVNPAPNFDLMPAKVRINAAAILREDALYRKQQQQDVQLLKRYEEELRDPSEYFLWQADMKSRDAEVKLQQVTMRREQAKQSADEAREAMIKQREDNKIVADLLRLQAEEVKRQKDLEQQIVMLKNQEVVKEITEVRDTAPRLASQRVLEERAGDGKKMREQLEEARRLKEQADAREEEDRADKIRKLRALNTVHKAHVVVFDPTETGKAGFLDEMSYMEMTERLATERVRQEAAEVTRRQEILESKQKKAKDLEDRARCAVKARQLKAEAHQTQISRKSEEEAKTQAARDKAREAAAVVLEGELSKRREQKQAEQALLQAEQERIRRQQQYLGAALGAVEQTREEQLLLAKERKIAQAQRTEKQEVQQQGEADEKDRDNRALYTHQLARMKALDLQEKERNKVMEKRLCMEKLKAQVVEKKGQAVVARQQHQATRAVVVEHNPYAAKLSEDIHDKIAMKKKLTMSKLQNNTTNSNN